MRWALFPAIALVGASALAPAVMANPSAHEARAVLQTYGQCIVKREPDVAKAYVLSGEFYNRNDPQHRLLVQRECLPDAARTLGMSNGVLGGAIADELFQQNAAAMTTTDFAAVPALHYAEPWAVRTTNRDGEALKPEQIEAQQKRFAEKQGEVLRARLGECVVRAAPAASRGVLVTPIDTPAELQALQTLGTALAGCLPAGQTIGFDRMTLRGTLAVAYYRLSIAAQPTGATR